MKSGEYQPEEILTRLKAAEGVSVMKSGKKAQPEEILTRLKAAEDAAGAKNVVTVFRESRKTVTCRTSENVELQQTRKKPRAAEFRVRQV